MDSNSLKKIGIVTVYNSINCGSFLQSYALQTAIRRLGFESYIVEAKLRKPFKSTILKSYHAILKNKIGLVKQFIFEYLAFKKYSTLLNVIRLEDSIAYCDKFALGSDEIWNVKRLQMFKYPILWGDGLPLDKCFSYAPSINTSTSDDLKKCPYFVDNIKRIEHLSVRDSNSRYELKKIFPNKKIYVCCDPTLLLDLSDYNELIKSVAPVKVHDYVFIYDFDRILEDEREVIIDFCRSSRKKIVIMGDHHWGDIRVHKDPILFISLIKNASYVITGTYHGTLFSILYHKKFVSLGRNNKKIYELLAEYGLSDRIYKINDNKSLNVIINMEYNHEMLKEEIDKKRQKSLKFLEDSIV